MEGGDRQPREGQLDGARSRGGEGGGGDEVRMCVGKWREGGGGSMERGGGLGKGGNSKWQRGREEEKGGRVEWGRGGGKRWGKGGDTNGKGRGRRVGGGFKRLATFNKAVHPKARKTTWAGGLEGACQHGPV